MSENQEFDVQPLHEIAETIDRKSYFAGEVPQKFLFDPTAFLPLNSDRLVGAINMVEKLLFEIGMQIEEEVNVIQKHQKRITFWEDKVEKSKNQIQKNELRIKQNHTDSIYDKKNRDYWNNRAEEVETDLSYASVANRSQDWACLVKKYGLKTPEGREIDSKLRSVEEMCRKEVKALTESYRLTASKYEIACKERETENHRLIRENAQLATSNETLQTYISSAYTQDIEPIQDGVLLMKELGLKLRSLGQDEKATYGDLRAWAEPFLHDFIRNNSRVSQAIVIMFRKLTSIPLPPEFC